MILQTILMATLCFADLAIAADYYISKAGSDANDGLTLVGSWATLVPANKKSLVPGDRILLEGGSKFVGPLLFDSEDHGTKQTPILVTSYGEGRATIDAGIGAGVVVKNTAGIVISKINIIGRGRNDNRSDGINFYNDLPGATKLEGIEIDEVDIGGFGNNGISIGGWNGESGFKNIRVTRAAIHDNGLNGLLIYAQQPNVHEQIYVGHVNSFHNSGKPTAASHSGSGIILGGVKGGIVEWSIARDNGWLGNAGIGIWAYDSTGITIQHNESFNNRTAGDADGGGFGLDGGVTHSVLQYNFSHGNDGAGYLLCQYRDAPPWFGNIVRHNLSIDDGRKNDFAGIQIWNGGSSLLADAEIHDNVVFVGPSEHSTPSALFFKTESRRFFVHHNAFAAIGEAFLIQTVPLQEKPRFMNNRCWSMASPILRGVTLEAAWCETITE